MIYDYKGYKLLANAADSIVTVVLRREVIMQTTSLDKAIRFVDGYIIGEHWAVQDAVDFGIRDRGVQVPL
jgi:hypothetical protein